MSNVQSVSVAKPHLTYGKRSLSRWIIYAVLAVVVIINLFPFYITLVNSLQPKTYEETSGPPPLWPEKFSWENFTVAWERGHFTRAYRNTIFLATASALVKIMGGSMAGYAFAKKRFPGERAIFAILLAAIMIPPEMTMVPFYLMMRKLHWVNTYLPLIVPGLGDVFAIFFFRQFMQTLPTSMLDAARIDGASELGLFFRIVLPNCKPALASLFIFSFQSAYNDFMGPLIYLNDERLYTVQLQLRQFERFFGGVYDTILGNAANLLATLPIIIVFVIFQRYLIEGVTTSGLKG